MGHTDSEDEIISEDEISEDDSVQEEEREDEEMDENGSAVKSPGSLLSMKPTKRK